MSRTPRSRLLADSLPPAQENRAQDAGRKNLPVAARPVSHGLDSLIHTSLIALAILAALFVVYLPALRGSFLWDDDTYITSNSAVRAANGLWAIWTDPSATCQYYPLSFTAFWLIDHFFGLNPLAFHVATLLLHGTVSILLWQVLKRLKAPGALLAGVIFAVHPINVMSVAWMTELKNTLSCSLALGSAWAYVRFAGLGVYEDRTAEDKTRWRFYGLSLGLFLLAMLAKTAVSFLPVSLLLVAWWKKERLSPRDLLSLLPMFGISVAMGALTIYIERHAGNASGPAFNIGLVDRLLISGRSFWFYLGKLVWPAPIVFIYPRWMVSAGIWWQWLFPLATAIVLIGAWLARRTVGKGLFIALMHLYVSTSLLILFVVLFMMQYSFVADHWAYFGSLSFCAMAAAAVTHWMDPMGRSATAVLGVAIAFGLGFLSWQEAFAYQDIVTLWRTTIDRNPDCWMARNNLANILVLDGHYDEAAVQFNASLRSNPRNAPAWSNLGTVLRKLGRIDDSLAAYRHASAIAPDSFAAHAGIGGVLADQGEAAEAIPEYEAALRTHPNVPQCHCGIANAYLIAGQAPAAAAEYREALRLNPSYAEAHAGLAETLCQGGSMAEVNAQISDALQLDPASAKVRLHLGIILYREGRLADSVAQYRQAVQLDPAFAFAWYNLGQGLSLEHAVADAIAAYRNVLSLNPGYAPARTALACLLAQTGDVAH